MKDFEKEHCDTLQPLARKLYKAYCEVVYDPYNLDYPEWHNTTEDVERMFLDSAIALYKQELPYLKGE